MWEEDPWYQKQQMLLIGIFLAVLFVILAIDAILQQQWDFLRFILLIAGALLFSMALFSGTAWLIIRIITRYESKSKSTKETVPMR